jgi:FkbM family methyltransferase
MTDTVTLFITACGRPDMLEICLRTFVKYNTHPISQVIICEDCEMPGIDDFAYEILPYPTKIIYNPKRLFQMKSIENGLQYITSEFVFHLEDDWEFYDYGFIEKSLDILKQNDKVTSVWLHNFEELYSKYGFRMLYLPIEKYYLVYPPVVEGFGYFSWHPGLRRVSVQKQGAPYPEGFDEGTLNQYFREKGMYAAMTNNINGYTRCIDWSRHIKNPGIGDNHIQSHPKNLAFEYFSQHGEDRHIYDKYLKHLRIENPVYLEMGALDGKLYSNTLFFERYLGWTGILVEPHPKAFQDLVKNRPNNKLYNYLVSNEETELNYLNYKNDINYVAVAGVLETLTHKDVFYNNPNNPIRDEFHITKCKPVTLTEIIKDSGFTRIDFFSLDVEGHEYNVLLSYDWSVPISTILVEDNHESDKVHELLTAKNYLLIEKISRNSFYALQN